jgi:predicted permease
MVYPPMVTNYPMNFTIEGRRVANTDELTADFFPITPNFFATMRIPMLHGRDFNDRDTVDAPWVAIINQTMARRFFPSENPIGKRISVDVSQEDRPREIVAVVKDIPATHPQTRQEPAIFVPFVQEGMHMAGPHTSLQLELAFLMRTQGDPMRALPAVRRAVEEIDRNRPLTDARTEESYLAEQAEYPRSYSMLLGLFAAVATASASVGIYGVMAFMVQQRTREIGIRMALGAGGWDVLKLIASQAMVVIAVGAAAGVGGAMALTRYISSEIWEVKASDPGIFTAVTALLISVAVAACVLPTRRAVQVDPNHALRHE